MDIFPGEDAFNEILKNGNNESGLAGFLAILSLELGFIDLKSKGNEDTNIVDGVSFTFRFSSTHTCLDTV